MKAAKIGVLCLMSLILNACAGIIPDGTKCPNKSVTAKTKRGGEGASSWLKIYPAVVKVKRGCSFQVRFPPGASGSTSNTTGQAWLNKPSTPERVEITVPLDKTPGEEFKYSIKVDGFGEIDPRIRVVL